MIPLSTSRLYVFNYSTTIDGEKLIKNIHDLIKTRFGDLTYRSIEIIIVKNSKLSKEIHFNHLLYRSMRTFDYETSNLIRLKINELLSLIPNFTFEQISLVNDNYDRRPSLGLSRQQL